MDSKELFHFRKKLNKTQEEIACLLGVSVRAVRSYEQGWRIVPVHVERQVLFLAAKKKRKTNKLQPCWRVKKCPAERKKKCPAWEFECGDLCWFINGTMCEGKVQHNWEEKMKLCKQCKVFKTLIQA